jgi:hypothetical protein
MEDPGPMECGELVADVDQWLWPRGRKTRVCEHGFEAVSLDKLPDHVAPTVGEGSERNDFGKAQPLESRESHGFPNEREPFGVGGHESDHFDGEKPV